MSFLFLWLLLGFLGLIIAISGKVTYTQYRQSLDFENEFLVILAGQNPKAFFVRICLYRHDLESSFPNAHPSTHTFITFNEPGRP